MPHPGEAPATRELAVDGVLWTVSVDEHHPRPASDPLSVSTYVWFTAGGVTRVAYVHRPASELLTGPERDLRALFATAVPALAG